MKQSLKKKKKEEEILMVPFNDDEDLEHEIWARSLRIGVLPLTATFEERFNASVAEVVVDKMIRTLSEREQEILRCRFFSEEQMTFKEIGTRLGISGGWAWVVCRRAFKKLRETQHAQSLHPLLEA